MPPLVGVAVNVTLVPAHIVSEVAVDEMLTPIVEAEGTKVAARDAAPLPSAFTALIFT